MSGGIGPDSDTMAATMAAANNSAEGKKSSQDGDTENSELVNKTSDSEMSTEQAEGKPVMFDESAIDYECEDDGLTLEVNRDEFSDLNEDDDAVPVIGGGGGGVPYVVPGCLYCDDERVVGCDEATYSAHLGRDHGVAKNVQFLTAVTIDKQKRDFVLTEAVSPEPLFPEAGNPEAANEGLDNVSDIDSSGEDEVEAKEKDAGLVELADDTVKPSATTECKVEEVAGKDSSGTVEERGKEALLEDEGVEAISEDEVETSQKEEKTEQEEEESDGKREWEYKRQEKGNLSDLSLTDDEDKGGKGDNKAAKSPVTDAKTTKETCTKCDTPHVMGTSCRFLLKRSKTDLRKNLNSRRGRNGESSIGFGGKPPQKKKIRTLPAEIYNDPCLLVTASRSKVRTLPSDAYHNPDALSGPAVSGSRRTPPPTNHRRSRSPGDSWRSRSPGDSWRRSRSPGHDYKRRREPSGDRRRSRERDQQSWDKSWEQQGGGRNSRERRRSGDSEGRRSRGAEYEGGGRTGQGEGFGESSSGLVCQLCKSSSHPTSACRLNYCQLCNGQGHSAKDCTSLERGYQGGYSGTGQSSYAFPPPTATASSSSSYSSQPHSSVYDLVSPPPPPPATTTASSSSSTSSSGGSGGYQGYAAPAIFSSSSSSSSPLTVGSVGPLATAAGAAAPPTSYQYPPGAGYSNGNGSTAGGGYGSGAGGFGSGAGGYSSGAGGGGYGSSSAGGYGSSSAGGYGSSAGYSNSAGGSGYDSRSTGGTDYTGGLRPSAVFNSSEITNYQNDVSDGDDRMNSLYSLQQYIAYKVCTMSHVSVSESLAELTAANVIKMVTLAGFTKDGLMQCLTSVGPGEFRNRMNKALQNFSHKFPGGITASVVTNFILEFISQTPGRAY